MMQDFEGQDVYKSLMSITPSRHLSVVFNLFVFFQIFNMLAARKINDEFNFFDGIHTNAMFLSVWFIIVIGQVLITQFGSKAMKVHIRGLTGPQWIYCVACSAICLIWNAILKCPCISDKIFPKMGDETPEEVEEAALDYKTLRDVADLNRQRAS